MSTLSTAILSDYKPFYVQRTGEAAKDTYTEWGLVIKTNPYPIFPDVKDVYSIDWKDEDGEDDYVDTSAYFESIDFEVVFVYTSGRALTSPESLYNVSLRNFFGLFRDGEFAIYDSYTGIGLQGVRMVGYSTESYKAVREKGVGEVKVKLRCNDPTTRMYLSDGYIVSYAGSWSEGDDVYSPSILDYDPYYIQSASSATAKNTLSVYGCVAKGNPVPEMPDAKSPYSSDSPIEQGAGEWVDYQFYGPLEYSVSFFVKAYSTNSAEANDILLSQVLAFRTFLAGGKLLTYDAFRDLGFQEVRYLGGSVEGYLARDNWARLLFTVRFKTNDPITMMTYEDGAIVAASYALYDSVATPLYSSEGYRLYAHGQ